MLKNKKDGSKMFEVQCMQYLNHPNILKLYECFNHDDFYYIITELCDGGSLTDKLYG